MTRKRRCHSKSNGFVTAAEQVCLQPVLEHRQRRGRHNIAWQAIPQQERHDLRQLTDDKSERQTVQARLSSSRSCVVYSINCKQLIVH